MASFYAELDAKKVAKEAAKAAAHGEKEEREKTRKLNEEYARFAVKHLIDDLKKRKL